MADDSVDRKRKDLFRTRLGQFTIPPFVHDPQARKEKFGLPEEDDKPGDYIIELNLMYYAGLEQAGLQFRKLYEGVLSKEAGRPPQYISKSYYKCHVSVKEIRELVQKDEEQAHVQKDSTEGGYADPRPHSDIIHPETAWAALAAAKIVPL